MAEFSIEKSQKLNKIFLFDFFFSRNKQLFLDVFAPIMTDPVKRLKNVLIYFTSNYFQTLLSKLLPILKSFYH